MPKILIFIILLPAVALAWGKLSDVRYKIKSTDGNMWSHLTGGKKMVRGEEKPGTITFTFDDGPNHRTTPYILDQLDRYGIKAAFFINGTPIHPQTAGGLENQAVLREIYLRGHYIGNHTYSHKDITKLDNSEWRKEVLQVRQVVESVTGSRPWIFRPPFGCLTDETAVRLSEEGYTIVMWNLDPLDWKAKNGIELFERTKKVIEDNPKGGILLLHDTQKSTVTALPLIVEWLTERNTKLRAMSMPTLKIVGLESYIDI